ncbi:MAG: hypothetical protein ACRDMV_21280 [Streptosporangiales bacterium]
MDPTVIAGVLAALCAPIAGLLYATGRRKETRAKQWDDIVTERNELQGRLDELRRKYDELLEYVYDLRASLHGQGIDVPPMPRDRDG